MKRNLLAPAVVVLVLLGLVQVVVAGRVWATSQSVAPGLVSTNVVATGTAAHGFVVGVGLLVAACGVAVLAARGLGRRLVGALALLASLAAAVAIAIDPVPASTTASVPGSSWQTGTIPGRGGAWELTAWPWIAVALLVASALVGAAVVIWSARWPTMSKRYDAPSQRVDDDPWSALDRGEDPTR